MFQHLVLELFLAVIYNLNDIGFFIKAEISNSANT